MAAAVWGQAAAGTIAGTVLDPQHKAVAHAKVAIISTSLASSRTLVSDAEGKFVAAQLAPGGYRLLAAATGLELAKPQAVTLGVGGSVQVVLQLAVAQSRQEVSVTAAGPMVEGQTIAPAADVDSARVANVVAGLTVTYLPNRDRDFTEFGALAAGAETGTRGLEVDGQRASATQVEVDGADFNDPLEGGPRGGRDGAFFFPQTVVQEFSLVHAGAGAEVGGTNGGFLNVATKEGSDRLHGEQFYIIRPAAWTGRDGFGHSLSDTQNEFGASLGGAVIKDKLFFYVGGEQDFVHLPYWTAFQPQAAAAPAAPAALAAQQTQTVGRNDPTALSLRLDYLLDADNSLNLEGNYNRIRSSNVNPGSTQVWTTQQNGASLSGQSDWIRLDLSTAAGPLTNQLLAQWAGDRRDLMPNSLAPEV
ncbi:MAG: carboxypeptidase regulatory-like domain-containing protein, partial [Terriglobales bacterium]